jgi:hypothetical protein
VVFSRFETVVRGQQGHRFTTIWMPMVSIEAVRLGNGRWQHRPVGKLWSTVVPADKGALDPEALAAARAVHDVRLP